MSKGKANKGSQRDIQWLFNDSRNRNLLEDKLKSRITEWLSPINHDDYQEYQDKQFMRKIGLGEYSNELTGKFWPNRGPVWDGLAKTDDGTILLFEAKAHISELFGGGMKARAQKSRDAILEALHKTARHIGADFDAVAWTDTMYQTANRLAHLYFLNVLLNKRHRLNEEPIKAKLIYLIFLNDKTVPSSGETEKTWRTAIDIADRYILKLPTLQKKFKSANDSLKDWVEYVFIDTNKLIKPAMRSI